MITTPRNPPSSPELGLFSGFEAEKRQNGIQNGVNLSELIDLVQGAVQDAFNIHDYEMKKKDDGPKSP